MRPNIPTTEEVKRYFRETDVEKHPEIINALFDFKDDVVIPPPNNQWELVLHTLIMSPPELSANYWSQVYKTQKWSTRLGEVEKDLGITLVNRERRNFVNRFGHESSYMVYKLIMTQEEYIEIYKKLQNGKIQLGSKENIDPEPGSERPAGGTDGNQVHT